MTSKFVRILLALVFTVSVAALAQDNASASPASSSPAAASPAAPSASASPSAASPKPAVAAATTGATGTKVGTINIEQAIFASNEGRRDFEALSKKLEPKQTELKGMNDEIEGLKKQLNTQGEKLNETTRGGLVKQIEVKQKSLDRAVQDAREEAQNQQNEIAQRILQKMAPVLVKYAGDNGFGIIIDTSQAWPQGPVVWWGQSVDVTKPIVDLYNAQAGVAAPTSGAAKPTSTRPGGVGGTSITPKPATQPPSKPQTNPPPK